MNELNKQIRTLELTVLDRKVTENDLKQKLELVKLEIKNALDSKDKAFSNDEKREAYAIQQPDIIKLSEELKNFEYNTKVMEIELRFKLRELQIVQTYMTKELI